MRKAKLEVQRRKALSRKTKNRLKPKDKHLSESWKKRNAARERKQDAHKKAQAETETLAPLTPSPENE